jgi:uncharacterized repeat protein (TIGR03803 family)
MIVGAAFAVALARADQAQASKLLKTLHSFCAQFNCADGENPQGGLAMDTSGILYGATASGGVRGGGTVFELVPPSDGKGWKYRVLYNFCSNDCADGDAPGEVTPVIDTAGNLYGTTVAGGSEDFGTVFKLSPNANRKRWTHTVLYNFCTRDSACSDGGHPGGPLTYAGAGSGAFYDGVSPLYGTSQDGGKHFRGVVYSLTPSAPGKWVQKTIYAFCKDRSVCADDRSPYGLSVDGNGDLVGIAGGGIQGKGIAFRLTPVVGERFWAQTVLHSFCSQANCADGAFPIAMTGDEAGSFFGTTFEGGNTQCNSGCGVIFKIAPDGTESVLYDFCSQSNCGDGSFPHSTLVIDQNANLFGTTEAGGANNGGSLFKFDGSALQVLYSFCSETGCRDGQLPEGGLILDQANDLFGLTGGGGKANGGTVFELTP